MRARRWVCGWLAVRAYHRNETRVPAVLSSSPSWECPSLGASAPPICSARGDSRVHSEIGGWDWGMVGWTPLRDKANDCWGSRGMGGLGGRQQHGGVQCVSAENGAKGASGLSAGMQLWQSRGHEVRAEHVDDVRAWRGRTRPWQHHEHHGNHGNHGTWQSWRGLCRDRCALLSEPEALLLEAGSSGRMKADNDAGRGLRSSALDGAGRQWVPVAVDGGRGQSEAAQAHEPSHPELSDAPACSEQPPLSRPALDVRNSHNTHKTAL